MESTPPLSIPVSLSKYAKMTIWMCGLYVTIHLAIILFYLVLITLVASEYHFINFFRYLYEMLSISDKLLILRMVLIWIFEITCPLVAIKCYKLGKFRAALIIAMLPLLNMLLGLIYMMFLLL